jgi:hypothetical protein
VDAEAVDGEPMGDGTREGRTVEDAIMEDGIVEDGAATTTNTEVHRHTAKSRQIPLRLRVAATRGSGCR